MAHWVWLAWLPQLLTSLQRPEVVYTKRILVDLARIFPQVSRDSQVSPVVEALLLLSAACVALVWRCRLFLFSLSSSQELIHT